jgi:hypothetical protein
MYARGKYPTVQLSVQLLIFKSLMASSIFDTSLRCKHIVNIIHIKIFAAFDMLKATSTIVFTT